MNLPDIDYGKLAHRLSSVGFWAQVYLQFVGGCSLVARALTPLEEWAHVEAPGFFVPLHKVMELLRKYASLDSRPNLPGLRAEPPK